MTPLDPSMMSAAAAAPAQLDYEGQTPDEMLTQPAPAMSSDIRREAGDVPTERMALVKRLCSQVQAAKKHYDDDFKEMRDNMRFLAGEQWQGEGKRPDSYVANIIQQHIRQKVAALYAKNPTAVCRRREMLNFTLWDETMASLQNIQATMMNATAMGMPPDPQISATLQDVLEGTQKQRLMDKVAKTLEIVFAYYVHQQHPPFKGQMKQLVRRTLTNSVGYVKLGYQRAMEKRPDDVEKITDITQKITQIERILADIGDGECEAERAECEQLKLSLATLEKQPEIIVSEGLVFDFPRSNTIIPDPRCTQLAGFVGAQWVAQEFLLTADDIKDIYKVDISTGFTAYNEDGARSPVHDNQQPSDVKNKGRACVWEIYAKTENMRYVVVDGFADFLQEPGPPPITLARFWPFFTLCFNQAEDDVCLFPPSDVTLLKPMQVEHNRARNGLREHRKANRPKTAVQKGMLDEADKEKLMNHPANAVLELNALGDNRKIGDVLQPIVGPAIDPALYDTEHLFTDVQRVGGSAEANLGGTSGATATESSIAEGSRTSGLASNTDDLDDMLTEIARAAGEVLLNELSPETAKRIAGPGAVWPELSAADIAQEIHLEVEAGSSGRPNKAAEIQNWERLAPIMLQIPGISPEWMAKQTVKVLGANVNIADAITSGAQSIISMNSNKQVATGNAATDPAMQGAQGAQNAPQAPGGPSPMQQDTGAPTAMAGQM